jgi:hypothetical protein
MVKLLAAIVGTVIFGKIALFCLMLFCLHMLGYF